MTSCRTNSKFGSAQQVFDVSLLAREQVVEAQDLMPLLDQPIAEM